MKAKGLGRGLGSLIDHTQTAAVIEDPRAAQEVPVNRIDPCKTQPRKTFDEEKLGELAASIRRFGVIQPLVLRRDGDRYTIVAGERRYRAARMAGLTTVPAVVRDLAGEDILQVSIIENIQREDLNPIEEAQAIRTLMDSYGFTQEKVSEGIGRSRSAVANTLRLLALPAAAQELVAAGRLSAGHARTLLPLKSEERILAAAQFVEQRGLSVRETERYVAAQLKERATRAPRVRDPELHAAEKALGQALETRVQLSGDGKRGKIVISYYSSEQLDALYDLLTRR